MMEIICQIWIVCCGATAIWFVGRLERWKRWGYIFGLLSTPAWFYTTIKHEQWGIFILAFFYTYAWIQGIYNYWVKKNETIQIYRTR